MKLLLKIKYDGSAYHGFQFQPNAKTVQGVLTDAVSTAFGFPCTVTGCSRTDSGVHALGYCAAVEPLDEGKRGDTWCTIPSSKVHRLLNQHLPMDIAVVGACRVQDSFHPRYSVVSKEYVYRIHDGAAPDPFLRDRAYHLKRSLSDEGIALMNYAGEALLGQHDFSAFMAQGSSVKDTVRTLFALDVTRVSDGDVVLRVSGDGFLYNMVRIITGTLLDVASGKISADDIRRVVDGRDRTKAGFTAPAEGLYLNKVIYGEELLFEAD